MRTLSLAAATIILISLNAFGSDCTSTIQLRHKKDDGKETVVAKNISGKPIVAYVVATEVNRTTGDRVQVFSGVFTDGDSLHPGASLAIGSVSSNATELKPVIDYVRLADGSTCGAASTNEAKAVAARFVTKP
jgi:hypothetical protein